jgi:SWI/SNF-related matrix-associated actin-dependent regulator of chromatin subfamily A3
MHTHTQTRQAMQRVHRIGQTRPVTVIRFLCQDTIEQHMLEMQERKDWLGKAALRRLSAQELRDLRVRQLRSIFTPASSAVSTPAEA